MAIKNSGKWFTYTFISTLAIGIIPLILLLFEKRYRYYLKFLGISLLIYSLVLPLLLTLFESKFVAILILIAGIVFVVGYFIRCMISAITTRCPKCKKLDAIIESGRNLIKKEEVPVKVKLENTDTSGKVVGYSEQYIPYIRSTYEVTYSCVYCGYTYTETVKLDKEKI